MVVVVQGMEKVAPKAAVAPVGLELMVEILELLERWGMAAQEVLLLPVLVVPLLALAAAAGTMAAAAAALIRMYLLVPARATEVVDRGSSFPVPPMFLLRTVGAPAMGR